MGALADAMMEYARPLVDETDGSYDQMNRALALSQYCWNISLAPNDKRESYYSTLKSSFELDDDEFNSLRIDILEPMILRHQEMFPHLHTRRLKTSSEYLPSLVEDPQRKTQKYPGAAPYSPCPCGSGKKYKFCCRNSSE